VKASLNLIIAMLIVGLAVIWMTIPLTIHSDGRPGIKIRVLPIRYGLLSDDYRKHHEGEYWPGGCSVGINDAKWVVVF
jgi:hypothetical protein